MSEAKLTRWRYWHESGNKGLPAPVCNSLWGQLAYANSRPPVTIEEGLESHCNEPAVSQWMTRLVGWSGIIFIVKYNKWCSKEFTSMFINMVQVQHNLTHKQALSPVCLYCSTSFIWFIQTAEVIVFFPRLSWYIAHTEPWQMFAKGLKSQHTAKGKVYQPLRVGNHIRSDELTKKFKFDQDQWSTVPL